MAAHSRLSYTPRCVGSTLFKCLRAGEFLSQHPIYVIEFPLRISTRCSLSPKPIPIGRCGFFCICIGPVGDINGNRVKNMTDSSLEITPRGMCWGFDSLSADWILFLFVWLGFNLSIFFLIEGAVDCGFGSDYGWTDVNLPRR